MPEVDFLPLALLYTSDEQSISGYTRLQKLIFLFQEETDVPDVYEFKPDHYGPFSSGLREAVSELEDAKLVTSERRQTPTGNEKELFRLTTKGEKLVEAVCDSSDHEQLTAAVDAAEYITEEYDQPLSLLLEHLSEEYGQYDEELSLEH